jgi:hypothetical protein
MIDPSLRAKPVAFQAQEDFAHAHQQAFIDQISSFLTRSPNELLSFEAVRQQVPIQSQTYRGVQTIPVSSIVGSVGRYDDFNRNFFPRQTNTRSRWENVDKAVITNVSLPPIEVYKMGEVYFVKDGNHRVSVAREKGMQAIDAMVIELETKVPLTPGVKPQELLHMAEYARFLQETNLDKLCPGSCIEFTSLGRYDVLIEHISAHRWYMGIEQNRPVSWEEAVADWYNNLYVPLAKIIEEQGILKEFPRRTVGDLYLWIMDHRYYLSQQQGEPVGAQTAVLSYNRSQVKWANKVVGWTNRMLDYMAHPFVVTRQALRRALKSREKAQLGAEDAE